jgi:hypothetical protein
LPGGFGAWQAAQTAARRAPQPPQNRAAGGFAWPQPEQVTR